MSKEKVEIVGYEATVGAHGITVHLVINGDLALELYDDESKALRKALKRAEKKLREARR